MGPRPLSCFRFEWHNGDCSATHVAVSHIRVIDRRVRNPNICTIYDIAEHERTASIHTTVQCPSYRHPVHRRQLSTSGSQLRLHATHGEIGLHFFPCTRRNSLGVRNFEGPGVGERSILGTNIAQKEEICWIGVAARIAYPLGVKRLGSLDVAFAWFESEDSVFNAIVRRRP